MADVNYYQLVVDYSKRDNYDVVYRSTLEDMAAKVDFSQVKSCVAFGTGSGEREIEFARRLLPNLQSFTAVEPDSESVKALRANFQDGKLPGVETSVMETTLESWSGVQNHVDAVLLFDMLLHIPTTERKALFQKLSTQYLSSGGIVAIIISNRSFTSVVLERLGMPRTVYGELEEEMVDAGFRVVLKQDFEVCRDLSDSVDALIIFIKMMTNNKFSESEMHTAISDVGPISQCISNKTLAIFTK